MSFIKSMEQKLESLSKTSIIRFLYSNFSYIIWFAFYFTFAWMVVGSNLRGFLIVGAVYGVAIIIALSPIGEIILLLLEECREPSTEQEKNYLLPLFEEVYDYAKEMNPSLNKKIRIYIMDAMYVNAFAMGRKSVAVTMGAVATFTPDELKGIIAHELGHMAYGHSKAMLLSVIGNFFFSVVIWVLRLLLSILIVISNTVGHFSAIGYFFGIIIFIVKMILEAASFAVVNISQMILAMNSRSNEIQADTFAYEIGYGKELIDGMYLLQKAKMGAKVKLSQRVKASHPHLAYRIARLEKLENEGVGA